MTISTYKLNRITFFPIAYPTILIAFPSLFLFVWMMYIQSYDILKSTQLTFIAEIFEKFGLVSFVVLFLFGSTSNIRFFDSLLSAFVATISQTFGFIRFVTNKAFLRRPTCIKITFQTTILSFSVARYSELLTTMFTIIIFHIALLYKFTLYLSNVNEKYCISPAMPLKQEKRRWQRRKKNLMWTK